MDNNDILKAMEARIQQAYPGEAVYWDRLPKDFTRPSFSLELQKVETRDVNIGLVEKTAQVLVTCFVQADAYGDSSREALNQRQDKVAAIFSAYLPVKDRVLTSNAVKGTGEPEFSDVAVTFRWTDVRPGYVDEDTAPESVSGVPAAEHYQFQVTEKE